MDDLPQNKFLVHLPGGVFIDDVHQKDVYVLEPNGFTEELISKLSDSENLAFIVTILLSNCIKQIGDTSDIRTEYIRKMPVGDRNFLVLKLREITFGNKIDAVIQCPDADCNKKMDISFLLSNLPVKYLNDGIQYHNYTVKNKNHLKQFPVEITFEYRLPNGEDQELLAKDVLKNEKEAVEKLLARCVFKINGKQKDIKSTIESLPKTILSELENEIKRVSPGIETRIEAICPECFKKFEFEFNIAEWFINEMTYNTDIFFRQTHLIAFYYKWTEREILLLERSRRIKYAEMISEELKTTMNINSY